MEEERWREDGEAGRKIEEKGGWRSRKKDGGAWRLRRSREAKLTFGAGEEKVVGAVNTENSFTVTFCHVNTLQCR